MRRASPLLIAALAAGCGFLGADPFTGTRVGDGIAPWGDLGPAQVCLGQQYLGAPDQPAGGLCLDQNVQEAPCTRDSECRSREACVCGACTVAFCSAASDCGAGHVCTFSDSRCDLSCFASSDCPDGAECHNGVCRGRCLKDSDCQTGEVCNTQDFCVTAHCSNDAGCLSTETCRLQRTPRQVLEPSAAWDPSLPTGPVVVWLEIADPVQRAETAIYRAVSSDGLHFDISPAQPVLSDGTTARAPSVVRTPDGRWAMYYEVNAGAEIRVATSLDGISWTGNTTAITGGTGAAAARAPAAVVMPDGTAAVYYQVGDGSAISLATGPIGGALADRGIVLRASDVTIAPSGPDAPFWKDVQRVTSPEAAITSGADGPSLRLWFSAYGTESGDSQQFGQTVPIPPNYSIGYASASISDPSTLTPWPYGPVVDRVTAFLSHHDEFGPSVAQLGDADGYLLYYVPADPDMNGTPPDGPYTYGRLAVLGNGDLSALSGAPHP